MALLSFFHSAEDVEQGRGAYDSQCVVAYLSTRNWGILLKHEVRVVQPIIDVAGDDLPGLDGIVANAEGLQDDTVDIGDHIIDWEVGTI